MNQLLLWTWQCLDSWKFIVWINFPTLHFMIIILIHVHHHLPAMIILESWNTFCGKAELKIAVAPWCWRAPLGPQVPSLERGEKHVLVKSRGQHVLLTLPHHSQVSQHIQTNLRIRNADTWFSQIVKFEIKLPVPPLPAASLTASSPLHTPTPCPLNNIPCSLHLVILKLSNVMLH